MVSLSFILTVVALILYVVALAAHFSRQHGGLSLPLTMIGSLLVSIALLIAWGVVGFVHFGPVR